MAPPTRLRPHLNDLLQKNLELEHVVADLRHQLTQSTAKWADERKTLAVGCDSLMASFAKFRARLDVYPSDWADSEGEVEQNLDAGMQSEEAGEVDSRMVETERDQGSLTMEDVQERCRTLIVELRARDEELEESRRKREAAEEELQRVRRLLDAQCGQLQAAPAQSKADTGNKTALEHTPDGTLVQTRPPKTGHENTLEKLDLANQEISRLRQLLQEWKKYGSDWKRDAQMARVRASELQLRENELGAQVKAAEERKALQDAEIQRLTNALADQTTAAEQHRTACEESAKRVRDLEAMVASLPNRSSPERLAAFGSEQNEATAGPPARSTQSPTAMAGLTDHLPPSQADTNANKRNDPILLKIPSRSLTRKPSTENNEGEAEQQNVTTSSLQAPATQSIRGSPAPQRSNDLLGFNPTEFEVCIHTCNTFPCRNDSRTFLWPRRQPSLPRHALSTKKHRLCSPDCPGNRLLNMPLSDAMREPRKAKCRPPTEAEIALAAEEANWNPPSQKPSEKEAKVDEPIKNEVSRGSRGLDDAESESSRNEEAQDKGEEVSPQMGALSTILGKRRRLRLQEEESQRNRKLRPRISMISKP